jgi:predicted Zn-dependent protease
MKRLVILAALALSACVEAGPYGSAPLPAPAPAVPGARPDPQTAAENFVSVVARMEPVIERECRLRSPGLNCDFLIVVDERMGQSANAFQTVTRDGRPVVGFTLPLIADARSRDELAFVLGHEAAHHILQHIPAQKQSAVIGAAAIGALAAAMGGDAYAVQSAQEIGASIGARLYSRDNELQADQLGTVIAWTAGYDPLGGYQFFARSPDPGDQFLGTHPPNAERQAVVQATVARLGAARGGV